MPKQSSGVIARPVCDPNVVANDAARPTASPTMIEATLSSPTPPSSSGTSVPRSPSSPARFMRSRASAQSFCSSRSVAGITSLVMNSSAVPAISRCSSVSCSGVKIESAGAFSMSQDAPRVVVAVVMSVLFT